MLTRRRGVLVTLGAVAAMVLAGLGARPEQERIGDSYNLANCPVSGAKLGPVDPTVVKLYEGREIRFCCAACPATFEKDLPASLAKVDQQIIKDQAPLYPLKTSVVTGKALPENPVEFVHGNRLIRVGSEDEKKAFLKDTEKFMAVLDKGVIEQQGKDYPNKVCAVSGGELGSKPAEVVVGGRLLRLCCKSCLKKLEKEPGRYVAQLDEARRAAAKK